MSFIRKIPRDVKGAGCVPWLQTRHGNACQQVSWRPEEIKRLHGGEDCRTLATRGQPPEPNGGPQIEEDSYPGRAEEAEPHAESEGPGLRAAWERGGRLGAPRQGPAQGTCHKICPGGAAAEDSGPRAGEANQGGGTSESCRGQKPHTAHEIPLPVHEGPGISQHDLLPTRSPGRHQTRSVPVFSARSYQLPGLFGPVPEGAG